MIEANSQAFAAAVAQVQATLTVNLLRRHVLDNHIPRDEMPEWAEGLARAAIEAWEAQRARGRWIKFARDEGLPGLPPSNEYPPADRRGGPEML